MRLKFASLVAGAFLFLAVPAFAGPVNLCGASTGDVGPSLTSGSITATGWQGTSTGSKNTSTDLYCKVGGADETGLGIASDPEHEIGTGNFVQLAGLSGSVTLQLGSLQSGETFSIFGSDSNGFLGSELLASGSGTPTLQSVTVNMGECECSYLDITSFHLNSDGRPDGSGNTLIDSVNGQTPEPSTYLLLGTGLLMLGFFTRRKYASAAR